MTDMEQIEKEHEKQMAPRKKEATIKLVEPVTFGSETISVVILKAPKGKHLKLLPPNPALKDILNMASKVSGVSSVVIDEMCATDVLAIAEAMGELL